MHKEIDQRETEYTWCPWEIWVYFLPECLIHHTTCDVIYDRVKQFTYCFHSKLKMAVSLIYDTLSGTFHTVCVTITEVNS